MDHPGTIGPYFDEHLEGAMSLRFSVVYPQDDLWERFRGKPVPSDFEMTSQSLWPGIGLRWVRESLEAGHVLSRQLLMTRELELGDAVPVMAPGVAPNALDAPQWGCGGNRHESDRKLENALMPDASRRLVIVEDPVMSPGDPVFADQLESSVTSAGHVLHWRVFRRPKDGLIGDFIHRSASYPMNAVVLDDVGHFVSGEELSEARLQLIAQHARAIVVGAYDNEGYTVWTPRDNVRPRRR